jgi:hypothetical protein
VEPFIRNEKEPVSHRDPVYAGIETPAGAGICIVPEALCGPGPLFFTQTDCLAVLCELKNCMTCPK